MPRRAPRAQTLDLFSQPHAGLRKRPELHWPDAGRFPLNLDSRAVRDKVLSDLSTSRSPLIVTGFAALDEIIEFVADCAGSNSHIRILFGQEPFASRREEFQIDGHSFTKEVEEYWLGRGISLLLSAKLILIIDLLKKGRVEAAYLSHAGERLHAKIYVGDDAVTLGSSNFTKPGLDRQLEANARFTKTRDAKRYYELCEVAENYWTLGRNYRDELITLLEQLLRLVTWPEALARACAELLEGEWARRYMDQAHFLSASELWPSQRQGIAQALYILSRQGSILVADATGSGKTRMGAQLVGAVMHQQFSSGRMRNQRPLMICPPMVEQVWNKEAVSCGTPLSVYSHGALSQRKSEKHTISLEELRRAQILCVDEGHNFLNLGSQRAQHLLRNLADHVMLFTATPINRSVRDLLRIADMLGADNLEPSTLDAFQKMLGRKSFDRTLTEEELKILRGEIQRFTLRRTKRVLNELIRQEPEEYKDARGKRCRFPKHRPKIYALNEPDADRKIAAEIAELAGELHGVTHFRKPVEMPEILKREGWDESKYLSSRLKSAKKLASYIVMSSLRSSRAALIEHISGSEKAATLVKLKRYRRQRDSGRMLDILEEIAGNPPENNLSIELPEWLTLPDEHRRACAHDRGIYAGILKRVARMSDQREKAKAKKLISLIKKHDLVLAFDSRPITLAHIAQTVGDVDAKIETLVATGDQTSQRKPLTEKFAPGSEAKRVIGMCSDSLSEGVNLQQSSCVVHLDMPSVVRIAEQRVGRVDRMDSPHAEIEAWWPEDAPEFALSSDDRFVERYETVDNLLGSNLPLPEEMQKGRARKLTTVELIEEFEKTPREEWDGIQDAFEPVRALIEGDSSLISAAIYDNYRSVTARILSRVSVVKAKAPWAFFCIAAGPGGAPRWVLLPSSKGSAVTELGQVATELRKRLTPEVEDLDLDNRAATVLKRFLDQLANKERTLLSRKKQRALEEMEHILSKLMKKALEKHGSAKIAEQYHEILQLIRNSVSEHQPDWDEVAARWLDLIRPVWYERLMERRRTKPLLLKNIRKDLINRGDEFGAEVVRKFQSFPVLPPPDERILVCIVGVT